MAADILERNVSLRMYIDLRAAPVQQHPPTTQSGAGFGLRQIEAPHTRHRSGRWATGSWHNAKQQRNPVPSAPAAIQSFGSSGTAADGEEMWIKPCHRSSLTQKHR